MLMHRLGSLLLFAAQMQSAYLFPGRRFVWYASAAADEGESGSQQVDGAIVSDLQLMSFSGVVSTVKMRRNVTLKETAV